MRLPGVKDRLLTSDRTIYFPAYSGTVAPQARGSYVGYRTPSYSPYAVQGTPYPMYPTNTSPPWPTQRAAGEDQYPSVTAHSIFPADYSDRRNRRVYSTLHQAHGSGSANVNDNTPVAASHADDNKGDVRTYQESASDSALDHGPCRRDQKEELSTSAGVDTAIEDFQLVTVNRDGQPEDGNGSEEDGGSENDWELISGLL